MQLCSISSAGPRLPAELQQVNLFEVPKTTSRLVRQERLEMLISLSNAHRKIEKELRTLRNELLKDMLEGAVPEPGTHTAEVTEEWQDGLLSYRLEVY